jgi:hypothetical protein
LHEIVAARNGGPFADSDLRWHGHTSRQTSKPRSVTWAFAGSRLTESNRRPTHYESVTDSALGTVSYGPVYGGEERPPPRFHGTRDIPRQKKYVSLTHHGCLNQVTDQPIRKTPRSLLGNRRFRVDHASVHSGRERARSGGKCQARELINCAPPGPDPEPADVARTGRWWLTTRLGGQRRAARAGHGRRCCRTLQLCERRRSRRRPHSSLAVGRSWFQRRSKQTRPHSAAMRAHSADTWPAVLGA